MTKEKSRGHAPRSPYAKSLGDPKFKPRVVRPKKGKGAYARRPKHPAPGGFLLSPRRAAA